MPILLAKEPQGRLNNTLASASTHLARATINTYCLGIGTERLLGDLRVLASIEVKRKVCIPQNIWKRDKGLHYACGELGSHHSIIIRKKLKKQKKNHNSSWIHYRGDTTRQTTAPKIGETDRWIQGAVVNGTEAHKLPQETALEYENLNCNWWTTGGSARTNLRVKKCRGLSHKGSPMIFWDPPPGANQIPRSISEKNPLVLLAEGVKKEHSEMC